MCDFPAPMDNELVDGIDPRSWLNVGPSIIHFSDVMLQKQAHGSENLLHIRDLLTNFVDFVITFIKKYEVDTVDLKERIRKDIAQMDNTFEQKMKWQNQKTEIEIEKI